MDVITNYLEHMFRDYPPTPDILRIKSDLEQNMEDRYRELIFSGKSENEAAGAVIAEMGNLDELLREMGYDREQDMGSVSVYSIEEARNVIDSYRKFALWISAGLAIIFFAVSAVSIADSFSQASDGAIAPALFLIATAAGVCMFVWSGMRISRFNELYQLGEEPFFMVHEDMLQLQNDYEQFRSGGLKRLIAGIFLCIAGVVPVILFDAIGDVYVTRIGVPLMFLLLAVGISQLIQFGMITTAYHMTLGLGGYKITNRVNAKREDRISGIFWPIVVILYLGWSFLFNAWHISWIIWPISGLLWAVIENLLNLND